MSTQSEAEFPSIANLWAHGLTDEILVRALIAGEVARQDTTPHHPVTAAGFYRWAETTRELRDQLACLGWVARDVEGLATVESPCGENQIVVVRGDAFTGTPQNPQTAYPRGRGMERAVLNGQGCLFDDGYPSRGPFVWFLMSHRPYGTDEIRAELSLPESIVSGVVTTWADRYLIETVDLAATTTTDLRQNAEDPDDPIEVPVVRKG